jgi:hypothetical protein
LPTAPDHFGSAVRAAGQRAAVAHRALAFGEQFEVGHVDLALAALDGVDQRGHTRGQRAAQSSDLGVHLGLALAHHQVPVDAAV